MRVIRCLGFWVTLALSASLTLTGCGGSGATPAEQIATAKQYLDQGKLRAAFIELSNALQREPNTVEARSLLARVAVRLGDGAKAEKEITRAEALGLPAAQVQPTLIQAIYLRGEADRVITESAELAAGLSKADQAAILGLRGQAFLRKRRFEQAEQVLSRALALDENASEALVGTAMLRGSRGEYAEARRILERARAAHPDSPEAASVLGDLELTGGHLEEAEKAFSEAIELRPYLSLDTAKRALVRLRRGEYQGAEADLGALRKRGFEDHPYVRYVEGINLFRQKDYESALTAFRMSNQNAPSFVPATVYLAITQLMLGNAEQALQSAESAFSKAPRSLTAARLLGSIHVERSEFKAAEDILQAALKNSPDNAQILHMLATVSLLGGNTQRGVEYSQRLLAASPESPQASNVLMLAKLMDHQSLDGGSSAVESGMPAKADDYTRRFLRAAEAMRNGDIKQVLERATKLHKQYPDRVDPLKLMAAAHLASGQWDKAKAELERVLEIRPQEPSATKNLAKVAAHEGDLKRARTLLEPYLKARPADAEATLQLATIEARLGQRGRGIEVLERALDANPKALAVRARLAKEYLAADRIEDVLKVSRELSADQFREQPVLLEARGRALMLSGDPSGAQRAFERWVEAFPDSAAAHFLYGDSLARTGELERAQAQLQKAIELDPHYLPARVAEVKMLARLDKLDSAQKALAKLRGDFGARPEVLAIEGWFAMGRGDFATAAKRFSAAQEKAPSSELLINWVRALWAQKNYDEAFTAMDAWLQDNPRDLAVLLHLAGGYLSREQPAKARDVYATVVKYHPEHLPALNNLAWLSRHDDLNKAIRYARKAQRLAPNDPQVLDTLGMLLMQNGDVARGYRRIREAAASSPEDLTIQLHLAQALTRQQRHAEARKVLDSVVEKAPDSSLAREAEQLKAQLPGS